MILLLIIFSSCRKEQFITSADAKVSVSVSQLMFDTLFTSTGSVTKLFKIFNENDARLNITQVSLRGFDNSYFRFNVDGRPGHKVENIEIAANDSVYVFVTVTIDPSDSTLPFIVRDTMDIFFNGNSREVPLSAWAQNANFLRSNIILSDTTWTNEKPIVILGGALIAEGVKLSIEKGTRIYLHADAPIIVDGTMEAIGEHYDSTRIYFQGDRLDQYYKDLPGSWPGIYFTTKSSSNFLKYVVIRHAYQALVTEAIAEAGAFKLNLEQVIIDNCYDAGIVGVNSSIRATNILVSNCGRNILLVKGGNYSFTHATAVSVGNVYIPHKQAVLTLADFIKVGDQILTSSMTASFVNCIFWGNNGAVEDEVVTLRESNDPFDVEFTNCIWKIAIQPQDVSISGMIENIEPMFIEVSPNENRYNFRLAEGSRGINEGTNAGIPIDLDEKPRSNIPDIGAYESTF